MMQLVTIPTRDAGRRIRLISDLSVLLTNAQRASRAAVQEHCLACFCFSTLALLRAVDPQSLWVRHEALQRPSSAPGGGALRRRRAHVQLGRTRWHVTLLVQLPALGQRPLALPHSQAPRHSRLADHPHAA